MKAEMKPIYIHSNLDYETDGGAAISVDVTCHQTSGNDVVSSIDIVIDDVIEPCTIAWSGTPFQITENSPTSTVIISTTDFTATFPEGKSVIAYSITNVGPGPANLFSIDSSTGRISVGSQVPDYENDVLSQTITVQCFQLSGNGQIQQDVVVEIVNQDEPCTLSLANTPYSVVENTASNTDIYPLADVTESFPEGEATPKFVIVSVLPGPSQLFDIDGTSGVCHS
ncbi:uncharacterized protein LOC144442603 [Glandiceps talaboti]